MVPSGSQMHPDMGTLPPGGARALGKDVPGTFPRPAATGAPGSIPDTHPRPGWEFSLGCLHPICPAAVVRRGRGWASPPTPLNPHQPPPLCEHPTEVPRLLQARFRELVVKLLAAWSLCWSECPHGRHQGTLLGSGVVGCFHLALPVHSTLLTAQVKLGRMVPELPVKIAGPVSGPPQPLVQGQGLASGF